MSTSVTDTDGKPMGENQLHYEVTSQLIRDLKALRPKFYVGGNIPVLRDRGF